MFCSQLISYKNIIKIKKEGSKSMNGRKKFSNPSAQFARVANHPRVKPQAFKANQDEPIDQQLEEMTG